MKRDPRARITYSSEGVRKLCKLVVAEPVASGPGAVVSRQAITGDTFVHHGCVRCGYHAALFAFEKENVGLCPRCTTERIERIAGAGRVLPPSVLWLHWETSMEIKAQDQRERDALSVRFDDTFRCARCGTIGLLKDARYWLPPGTSSSFPYCRPCLEVFASGYEEPTEREGEEYDFED